MLVLQGVWLPLPGMNLLLKDSENSPISGTGGPGMEDGAIFGAVGAGQSMVVTGMGRYCRSQRVDHSQGMQNQCLNQFRIPAVSAPVSSQQTFRGPISDFKCQIVL